MAEANPHIDPAQYPIDQIVLDTEGIEGCNPQRFEFRLLDSVLCSDPEKNLLVAHRHVPKDDFWTRSHFPGRPLMPGVLMLEALAQAACVHSFMQFERPEGKVIGLGGVEKARFRDSVKPGTDLWVAGTMERYSAPRATSLPEMDRLYLESRRLFGLRRDRHRNRDSAAYQSFLETLVRS